MSQDGKYFPPKYTWPRYVLAAVILFVVLAILWMSQEVARIQRIKKDTLEHKRALVPPETPAK